MNSNTPTPSADQGSGMRSLLKRFGAWSVAWIQKKELPPGIPGQVIATVILVGSAVSVLGAAALGAIKTYQWLKPKQHSYVALVGPPPSGDNEEGYLDWEPALRAIESRREQLSTGVLADVEFKRVDDPGSGAASGQILDRLCHDPAAIAIIGYVWSTPAKRALSTLAQCPKPLPVMLVAATEDALTDANANQWSQPILQLAPSNLYQAKLIAEGIGETYPASAAPNILQVLDLSNPAYAEALSRQVKTLVETYKKATPTWVTMEYGNQTWTQLLEWNGGPFDAIIFVGNLERVKKALAQRDPSKAGPLAIVTDGAVSKELLAESTKCVWGSFPTAASAHSDDGPSYADIGRDSVDLLQYMLEQAKRPTRAALTKEFRRLSERNSRTDIGTNRSVQFDYRGRRRGPDGDVWAHLYHFLQIRRGADGKLVWSHRERRRSLAGCGEATPPG